MKRCVLWILILLILLLGMTACAETASIGEKEYNTDLEYIDFGDETVQIDSLIPFLQSMPLLKKVDMFATIIEAADADRLTELFPEIEFGWTIHLVRKHYVRTDQTAFSTLHGNCNCHFAADLAGLKYCKKLKALDLGHNYIKDLSFLSELTELRVLILACNTFTDISVLENMNKLEYLELFTNKIPGDLSPLKGMTHLLDLNISNCYKITDVSELYDLKQIKRLWMTHTHVKLTKAKRAEIQEAFPDAEINFDAVNPTAGGWRKHPHYDVIQKMFASGEYIPFEDSYVEE